MNKTRAWMVRAGDNNEIIDDVLENSVVAIGWSEIGNVSNLGNREEVKEKYEKEFPEHKKWRKSVNSGQIFRFCHKIKKGDYVLTYDKSSREIHIGKIESKYKYKPPYPNIKNLNVFINMFLILNIRYSNLFRISIFGFRI